MKKDELMFICGLQDVQSNKSRDFRIGYRVYGIFGICPTITVGSGLGSSGCLILVKYEKHR